MSWWDYGYQITAMANRTILVDNNTWNNTHISRVGQVNSTTLGLNVYKVLQYWLNSALLCRPWHPQRRRPMRLWENWMSVMSWLYSEDWQGIPQTVRNIICSMYQYKVVCKCSSLFTADINKFLWMVRIGGSTDTGKHIKEHDYYTPTGEFRVDREGSPVLLNCLMYKMCYYRFGQVYTEGSK